MNPDIITGWHNIAQMLGVNTGTVRRWPDFPQPMRFGPRRVGWLRSDVEAWLSARPRGIIPRSPEHKAAAAAGARAKRHA
jgi:predicted DNA-binding transcriptional regulator AlpA